MRAAPSHEELSDLIGAVYDCALDPARWAGVMDRLRLLVDCLDATLTLHARPSGTLLFAATSNIGPELIARWDDYGADILDQWGGPEEMASHPLDEPVVLSWKRPRELWENNRYHAEWARPRGIVDVLAFTVARDAVSHGGVGMGRHVSAGPVTEREIAMLRLLVPHFQRSVGISRMLDLKTLAARSLEAALDAVAAGVVLVDARLLIVHANRAAREILAARDPIFDDAGMLSVRSDPARQALVAAVAQAQRDETLIGRRGFGIPARRGDGGPAVLHVLPLRAGSLRPGLAPGAAAAVFVAPATMPLPAPERALAALFDLTPSEAKVFFLIAAGKTIGQTAHALGIGESTARTHLLRLFAKTGTSRQAQLVRLGTSLSLFG